MKSLDDSLRRLATAIGVDVNSRQFRAVWEVMKQQAWTELACRNDFDQAVKDAKGILRAVVAYVTDGSTPAAKRRTRQVQPPSWLAAGTALAERMVQLARADREVERFRKALQACARRPRKSLRVIAERLARTLADRYWWGVDDAMRFLVTDTPPSRSPIRAERTIVMSGEGGHRIVLEIEDWVPPSAVRAVYARLQQGGRNRSARVRTITREAVDLVAFVEATPGSWAERLRQWNSHHPKNAFNDRANFRRAYQQAERRFNVKSTFMGA